MQMSLSETVNAPVEQVFHTFSDFRNAADRIDGIEDIEVLTDGPIGEGTRFRETRIMFGKASTEEMEVTEFVSGKRYAVEADSCGSHIRTVFHFRPNGQSTDVELELSAHATSFFAKLMWPLGKLMAGSMKKIILSDIQQLKAHCEN